MSKYISTALFILVLFPALASAQTPSPTGTLIVRKVVVGSASTTDQFSFIINGDSTTPFEADGENELLLPIGTYTIAETFAAGHIETRDNCNGIVLDEDETEICTITNTAIVPITVSGVASGAVEVGGVTSASGDLNGDKTRIVWGIVGGQIVNRSASFQYAIDDLEVIRNGSELFHDTFDVAPPAGPVPIFTGLSTWTTSNGRGILDSSGSYGSVTANTSPQFLGQPSLFVLASFQTNMNTTVDAGLRSNADFHAKATYDLIMPPQRSTYSLSLSDGFRPNLAEETILIFLARGSDNIVRVNFVEENYNTGVRITNSSSILNPAPGDDQIVFHLDHVADSHQVTASFDLLDDGVVTSTTVMPAVAPIFNYHDFVRVGVGGSAQGIADWGLEGTYGTLTVNHSTGAWGYELGVTAAQQAAIDTFAGGTVTDNFSVSVSELLIGPVTIQPISIQITKPITNQPPALASIGNQTVGEGETLTFTISATDPDISDTLTYSAANLPAGASFDPDTQEFSWTPTFAQAGNYDNVEFTATDNGTPMELDVELITVTVGDVNRAPIFDVVGSQTVDEGQTLTFAVNAIDPDGNSVVYSVGTLPLGAAFDPDTQQFTWTPTTAQSGNYAVIFYATDNGSPVEVGQIEVAITVGDVPTPTEQAEDLVDVVVTENLPSNIENSYLANLNKVATFIENGQIQAAINQLEAFINKVEQDYAQGKITLAQRDQFVTLAQALIDDLQ